LTLLSKKSKILLSTLVPLSAVFVTASVVTPIVINNKTFKMTYDAVDRYYKSNQNNVKEGKTYTGRVIISKKLIAVKELVINGRNGDIKFEVLSMKVNHTAKEKGESKDWWMSSEKSCAINMSFAENDYIEFTFKALETEWVSVNLK